MEALDALTLAACAAGCLLATLRWLRVAQREHYLAGETTHFAGRWWRDGADNALAFGAGLAAAVASFFEPPAALLTAVVSMLGPRRLGLRGRTGRLTWTRRLGTVAAVTALLEGGAIALGAVGGRVGSAATAALVALAAPLFVDLALLLTKPLEEVIAGRYLRQARQRLERVGPLVVAVTGSYGKTTVKGYIAHLVGPHKTTLASPQSFNNRAGLTRTVNELLGPATEVFVAEMGTYGRGEIAALCSWLRPEISVITAIGPAHLERFGSLDNTLAAKSEIAETARVVVLNVDDERLAALADRLRREGKKVVAASARDERADVAVLPGPDGLALHLAGRRIGTLALAPPEQPTAPSNAACAIGVGLELGIPPEDLLSRLGSLPVAANRLQRYVADGGYVVFDDTFNSNPQGARLGLARLAGEAAAAPAGRRVVVTPGMVELGKAQAAENEKLGEEAALVADQLIVVARTNRRALLAGAARAGRGTPLTFDRLEQAIGWVRANLGPGDAVLYENDLPDHFP